MNTETIVNICTIAIAAICAGASYFAGSSIGYRNGRRDGRAVGRDEGWNDHYIEAEREKRARRDRQGRFVAIRGNGVSPR